MAYDALDLLKHDHAALTALFQCYESRDEQQKQALVSQIIRMLTVHMKIEDGLFYPTLRRAMGDQAALLEADVEHAMIKKLMADLNRSDTATFHFDAKVRCLAHLVKHHVQDEEENMFRVARDSQLNLVALGGQLDAYRSALACRYELDTDGEELLAFLSATTVLDPAIPKSAPKQRKATARGDGRSAPAATKKSRGRIETIPLSRQSQARRSTHPETEAAEGESI